MEPTPSRVKAQKKSCQRLTCVIDWITRVRIRDGPPETEQAGTDHYGGPVDQRAVLDPRDSRHLPGTEPANLQHGTDNGLPAGSQKSVAPVQEDQQRIHL